MKSWLIFFEWANRTTFFCFGQNDVISTLLTIFLRMVRGFRLIAEIISSLHAVLELLIVPTRKNPSWSNISANGIAVKKLSVTITAFSGFFLKSILRKTGTDQANAWQLQLQIHICRVSMIFRDKIRLWWWAGVLDRPFQWDLTTWPNKKSSIQSDLVSFWWIAWKKLVPIRN